MLNVFTACAEFDQLCVKGGMKRHDHQIHVVTEGHRGLPGFTLHAAASQGRGKPGTSLQKAPQDGKRVKRASSIHFQLQLQAGSGSQSHFHSFHNLGGEGPAEVSSAPGRLLHTGMNPGKPLHPVTDTILELSHCPHPWSLKRAEPMSLYLRYYALFEKHCFTCFTNPTPTPHKKTPLSNQQGLLKFHAHKRGERCWRSLYVL